MTDDSTIYVCLNDDCDYLPWGYVAENCPQCDVPLTAYVLPSKTRQMADQLVRLSKVLCTVSAAWAQELERRIELERELDWLTDKARVAGERVSEAITNGGTT